MEETQLNQTDIEDIQRAVAAARQSLQTLSNEGGTAQQREILGQANSDLAEVAGTVSRL